MPITTIMQTPAKNMIGFSIRLIVKKLLRKRQTPPFTTLKAQKNEQNVKHMKKIKRAKVSLKYIAASIGNTNPKLKNTRNKLA